MRQFKPQKMTHTITVIDRMNKDIRRNVIFIPLSPSGYFPYFRARVCESRLFHWISFNWNTSPKIREVASKQTEGYGWAFRHTLVLYGLDQETEVLVRIPNDCLLFSFHAMRLSFPAFLPAFPHSNLWYSASPFPNSKYPFPARRLPTSKKTTGGEQYARMPSDFFV